MANLYFKQLFKLNFKVYSRWNHWDYLLSLGIFQWYAFNAIT